MFKYLLPLGMALAATPAVAQDFAGPRVEARIGYSEVGYEAEVDGEEGNTQEGAVNYGAEVGYDLQLGQSLVVGGYAGIDYGTNASCSELFGMDEACVAVRRNITLGGRVGLPLGQNALVFAKGGYTNARLRTTYEDFEDIIDDVSESNSLHGAHLGAGFEIAGGPNVYLKAEYVYTMYGGSSETIEDIDVSADVDRHQVLMGVGFRF